MFKALRVSSEGYSVQKCPKLISGEMRRNDDAEDKHNPFM